MVNVRRKQTKAETLYSHPLIKGTTRNLRWAIEGLAPKLAELIKTPGGLRKRGKTASYAPCDMYDYSVFNGATTILGTLDRLRYARHMLVNFPRGVRYQRAGITQDIWLEYHYSFFVVSLSSVSDLALLLTNSTYRLGMRPRDCVPNVIKENDWVRSTTVRKAIDRVENTVKAYRELKNKHVHHGEVPDLADLTDSNNYDLLKIITSLKEEGDSPVPSEILKTGYALEVSEIVTKLDSEIEKVTAAVKEFFDALLPIYQRTEGFLHQNPDKDCGRLRAGKSLPER